MESLPPKRWTVGPLKFRGPKEARPFCPKCDSEMVLRMAKKGRGAGNQFWGCSSFPRCMSTLDADPDGLPLGVPGDAETKSARVRAHGAFDRMWQDGWTSREYAYIHMLKCLGDGCDPRIGSASVATCNLIIRHSDSFISRELGKPDTPKRELTRLRRKCRARLGTMAAVTGIGLNGAFQQLNGWTGTIQLRYLDRNQCLTVIHRLEQKIVEAAPTPWDRVKTRRWLRDNNVRYTEWTDAPAERVSQDEIEAVRKLMEDW